MSLPAHRLPLRGARDLAGVLERIDESRCRLTSGARSLEGLAAWIGMMGVDFEVEEPPALIAYLRVVAARLHRAAEAGPR